jgi:hypothetical protein
MYMGIHVLQDEHYDFRLVYMHLFFRYVYEMHEANS